MAFPESGKAEEDALSRSGKEAFDRMEALIAAVGINGLFFGILKYTGRMKNRDFAKKILLILPLFYLISLFAFIFYLYIVLFVK